MPVKVSVHEAKTQLSRLLNVVEEGEEVMINRHGKVVARLVAVHEFKGSPLGAMQGEFTVADGWDRPLTAEESDAFWEGKW